MDLLKKAVVVLALMVPFIMTDPAPGPARAEEAPSFDQAMSIIAGELKAAGIDPAKPRPRKRSGKAGRVKFKLDLGPGGESRVTALKNTFGVTLDCRAMIVEPEGRYNVRVGTNAGSAHSFAKIPANREVAFELKTKGGLSRTEFFVELLSLEPPPAGEALVSMSYTY